jgi:hypothetical protein
VSRWPSCEQPCKADAAACQDHSASLPSAFLQAWQLVQQRGSSRSEGSRRGALALALASGAAAAFRCRQARRDRKVPQYLQCTASQPISAIYGPNTCWDAEIRLIYCPCYGMQHMPHMQDHGTTWTAHARIQKTEDAWLDSQSHLCQTVDIRCMRVIRRVHGPQHASACPQPVKDTQ